MLDVFKEMRASLIGSMILPRNRFFTPKPTFWLALKELAAVNHGLTFTDCGCGNGELLQECFAHGIKVDGCDLFCRSGVTQHENFTLDDATTLSWSPLRWPLICRPSHDGWADQVVRNARKAGARAIYVGLPHNYRKDVPGLGMGVYLKDVGEDGETMYTTAEV